MSKLLCVNKACGKYFELGSDEDCHHHSGGPVFHDALKGWSCCSKRVVDFDQFLKIPGCTIGHHTNVKPTEPVKSTTEVNVEVVKTENAAKPKISEAKKETFNAGTEMPKVEERKILEAELIDSKTAKIAVGAKCKRPACGKEFVSEESRKEECVFHNGSPVFHEGSKGWSCCSRKVLEFDEFLKIKGCHTGLHRFTDGGATVIVDCRRDWYQTQEKVMLSIFAKKVDKEKTIVLFDADHLLVDIKFEDGSSHKYDTKLFQPIKPEDSSFKIMSTKLEIQLCKANGISWAAIEPRSDIKSWTTFGLTNTGGGTVGAKTPVLAGDAPIHLLQK